MPADSAYVYKGRVRLYTYTMRCHVRQNTQKALHKPQNWIIFSQIISVKTPKRRKPLKGADTLPDPLAHRTHSLAL